MIDPPNVARAKSRSDILQISGAQVCQAPSAFDRRRSPGFFALTRQPHKPGNRPPLATNVLNRILDAMRAMSFWQLSEGLETPEMSVNW
jgi:hypothetical protein